MFGSNVLDIAIGLIMVFILMGTICTAIREFIEAKLKTRAAYLEQGIRQLLNDKNGDGIASALYNHPLIYGLFNGEYKPGTQNGNPDMLAKGKNLPSYIPSKNFAAALLDIAATGKSTDTNNATSGAPLVSLASMRQNIALMGNASVQRVLLNAIDTAQGDMNKAQKSVEAWYNSSMDRVSGWYKRSTQWVILWIALSMTLLLNVNTVTIVQYLSRNDTQRKVMVEQTAAYAKNGLIDTSGASAYKHLDSLNLPIGWDQPEATYFLKGYTDTKTPWNFSVNLFTPLLGWLITVFAASMGAPFWFDLLNKVMVIRSTVKPHEKSLEEDSQDNVSPKSKVNLTAPANTRQQTNTSGTSPDISNSTEPDGCDVVAVDFTADDELPASKGGMN